MRRLRKLDLPRGRDSWCWPIGAWWPQETRMLSLRFRDGSLFLERGWVSVRARGGWEIRSKKFNGPVI